MIESPGSHAERCRFMLLLVLSWLLALPIMSQAASAPEPLTEWHYRWGDSPLTAGGQPAWLKDPTNDWSRVASPSNPPQRLGHQHLWLRTTLPKSDWHDPVLYITSIDIIGQIYLDDELIYQHGEFDAQGRGNFIGWPWHVITLPEHLDGQTLTFRIYSDHTAIGLWGEVQVMERFDVFEKAVRDSAQDFAVSALVVVLAFLASIFALIGPERRGFAATALFAYAAGLMLLAETPARQLINDNILAWDTLRAASYFTLPIALGLLLSHWLEGTPRRWISRLWKLHVIYLLMALGAFQCGLVPLSSTFSAFDGLLLVTLPTMLALSLWRFRELNIEQRLLVTSFGFFALLLVADMAVAHGVIEWRSIPLSIGALAFTLANASIFLWHYRHTQKQLALAKDTLELQVAKRTEQLDQMVTKLESLSYRDALTSLYNRRYFDKRFDRECFRAKTHHQPLTLVMVDIDYFKHINDRFGHDAGDSVLKDMAHTLKHHFRDEDIVCRLGGEEFVALLPNTAITSAQERAISLLKAVAQQTFEYQQEPLTTITLSCGIANYPHDTDNPQELPRLADQALYHAKQSGRNRSITWQSLDSGPFQSMNQGPY